MGVGPCRYTDDIPHIEGELYAGLVLSSRPHARFVVDASTLEEMEVIWSSFFALDRA